MTSPQGSLTLNRATVRLEVTAEPVLREISLAIERGEVVALVGPNGAGKSTALRLLGGIHRPDQGVVTLDGHPLPRDARERARRVHLEGFETPPVFDFSVTQTVAMGRYPHRGRLTGLDASGLEIVQQALRQANLEHLAGRSVLTLSTGEFRRVALARALASDAEYLLFDEPTANLDLEHAVECFDLFRRLARDGRGLGVALHDVTATFDLADRVAVLREGRLIAFGTPTDVLTPDRIAEVFGVLFEHVTGPVPRTRAARVTR